MTYSHAAAAHVFDLCRASMDGCAPQMGQMLAAMGGGGAMGGMPQVGGLRWLPCAGACRLGAAACYVSSR